MVMQAHAHTRAAIYARISQSDPKVEATADQELRCRELAARECYTVVAVYSDDGISAFSGKTRPGWLALNDDLAADKFDVILAVAEDRLARNAEEKIGFQASCSRAGIVWHTIASGRLDPSTAQGGLLGTITGAVAEYESHIKQERVKASVARRLRDGIDLNGPRPFGFEKDRLTIRESEAAWVRWAVQAVLSGATIYSIRKRYNDEGVLTTQGRPWLTTTVRQMLLRPRNAGLLAHHGIVVSDTLPPLVTRAEWESMRSILEHPDRKPKRGPKVAHVGSGVVECSVCGSAMRFHTPGRGAARYVCTRERLAVRDNLEHPTILESDLERMLAGAVFMHLTMEDNDDAATDDTAPLRVDRAELARRRKVQQELAEMPGADLDVAAKRILELGQQIDNLDAKIAALVAADSRASLLAAAREALTEIDDGIVFIAGASMFPKWLPRWEATAIEKRQAIIRESFGPIKLGFKDLYLTKTDDRVKRYSATPEAVAS